MNYMKLVWAIAGAVALSLQTGLSDGVWTDVEKVESGLLVLAAVGTWLMPNTDVLRTAKAWVSGLLAGGAILTTVLVGGVTGAEWASILIAVLTTAGVLGVPMAPLHRTSGLVTSRHG